MKNLKLNNGAQIPSLGLGTWKSEPGVVGQTILEAIKVGYRHFDCAAAYGNEKEIGEAFAQAIAEGLVKREDLWITSKLWNHSHKKHQVPIGLEKTLNDLQLEYLDLYLIHWPVIHKEGVQYPTDGSQMYNVSEVPLTETWAAMVEEHKKGKAKQIGVSNFSVSKINEVWKDSGVMPAVNQVESHPYFQQKELLNFCNEKGIVLTAYCPLGSADRPANRKAPDEPILFDNPTLQSIAQKHDCTTAQVMLAWAVERDTTVIPKTVKAHRLRENLEAASIQLDAEDMQEIAKLDKGYRYVSGDFWCHEGTEYTLESIWG